MQGALAVDEAIGPQNRHPVPTHAGFPDHPALPYEDVLPDKGTPPTQSDLAVHVEADCTRERDAWGDGVSQIAPCVLGETAQRLGSEGRPLSPYGLPQLFRGQLSNHGPLP